MAMTSRSVLFSTYSKISKIVGRPSEWHECICKSALPSFFSFSMSFMGLNVGIILYQILKTKDQKQNEKMLNFRALLNFCVFRFSFWFLIFGLFDHLKKLLLGQSFDL